MNNVWNQIAIHAVGGLIQVGYANNSDLLLVLSHNGFGIFNCLTGQKVARNKDDLNESFNESTLKAKGFDILDGQEIKTAGLFGGNLKTKTLDGWSLSIRKLNYTTNGICLIYKSSNKEVFIEDDKVSEFRAFGFSETEKSFVVATTSDLTIYTR